MILGSLDLSDQDIQFNNKFFGIRVLMIVNLILGILNSNISLKFILMMWILLKTLKLFCYIDHVVRIYLWVWNKKWELSYDKHNLRF